MDEVETDGLGQFPSIPDPESYNGFDDHINFDCKYCTKNVLFLENFQSIQDLLISSQKKLKEYEAVSEYANCDDLKLLKKIKWTDLLPYEIPKQLSNFVENLKDYLSKIFNQFRDMDSAVIRLRNEIDKLNDQFKMKRFQRGEFSSLAPKSKHNLDNEKDINAIKKKFKAMIKERDSNIDTLKSEKDETEERLRIILSENKKLKKQMDDLKESGMGDVIKEMKGLQKQMKEITFGINQKEEENKKEKYEFERISKSQFKTLERIIESLRDKESQEDKINERTLEEMILIKQEIRELKEQSYGRPSENELASITELQEKESQLTNKVEEKELVINEMKTSIENIMKKLTTSGENESRLLHENEELRKEYEKLKIEHEKKARAIIALRTKVCELQTLVKKTEELEETQSQLKQSTVENANLELTIGKLNANIKERFEECEHFKKENLRLHTEMENMKKLNFLKKTGGRGL